MNTIDKIKELANASLPRMEEAMSNKDEVKSVSQMAYETGYMVALNDVITAIINEEAEKQTKGA